MHQAAAEQLQIHFNLHKYILETPSLGDASARSEALIMRRNVVKMLVACVCVYFICYSPIQGIFLSK